MRSLLNKGTERSIFLEGKAYGKFPENPKGLTEKPLPPQTELKGLTYAGTERSSNEVKDLHSTEEPEPADWRNPVLLRLETPPRKRRGLERKRIC